MKVIVGYSEVFKSFNEGECDEIGLKFIKIKCFDEIVFIEITEYSFQVIIP